MSTDELTTQERTAHPDPNEATTSEGAKRTAVVLEKAIAQTRFHHAATTAVCPHCLTAVAEFPDGLSDPFVRFNETCPDCEVELRPWSTIVSKTRDLITLDEDVVRNSVTQHWADKFRVGISNDGIPHTREFTAEISSLRAEWGWDWELSCPLCGRPLSSIDDDYLDYHHWEYESDTGTSVCRDCHDYIHGEAPSTDANWQDWVAKTLGLRDFRDLATIRLAERDRVMHDIPIPRDHPAYARRLKNRYNLPLPSSRISHLISEVRFHEDISNRLDPKSARVNS